MLTPPNPSIDRTATGKPVSAAHVKRWGLSIMGRFQGPKWQMFLRRIAPAVLLFATLAMSLGAGGLFGGLSDGKVLRSLSRAMPFAASVLLAIGAHAFGHYVAARRSGVDAYLPYFVPAFSISGISGAYVKLRWPIENRRALLRIFTAGPIVGFTCSAAVLLVGMALSEAAPRHSSGGFKLGESLLTLGAQRVLFPHMTESDDLVLHPIGFAGYLALYFNLWHLFPAGRLDGGRVVYALLGYRPALIVSWLTIVALAIMGTLWLGWLIVAVFAALTMIRLSRQHAVTKHEERLDTEAIVCGCLMLVVLVVTLVPVPIQVGP